MANISIRASDIRTFLNGVHASVVSNPEPAATTTAATPAPAPVAAATPAVAAATATPIAEMKGGGGGDEKEKKKKAAPPPPNKKFLSELVTLGLEAVRSKLMSDPTTDIDEANRQGVTALLAAVTKSDADLVSFLLQAGANVGHVDQNGRGVLWLVCQRSTLTNTRILDMLLAHPRKVASASLPRRADNGLPEFNRERLVAENILEIDAIDKNGTTPLFLAAQAGWLYGVRRLLAEGASINVAGNTERSPTESMIRWCYDAYRRAPQTREQAKQFLQYIREIVPREKKRRHDQEVAKKAAEAKAKLAAENAKRAAMLSSAKKESKVAVTASSSAPGKSQQDDEEDDIGSLFDLFGDDDVVPQKKPTPKPAVVEGPAATTTPATTAAPAAATPTLAAASSSSSSSASTPAAPVEAPKPSVTPVPTPTPAAAPAPEIPKVYNEHLKDIKPVVVLTAGDDDWKPTFEDHATMRYRYNKDDWYGLIKELMAKEPKPVNCLCFCRRLRIQHLIVEQVGGVAGVWRAIDQINLITDEDQKYEQMDAALETLAWYYARRNEPLEITNEQFGIWVERLLRDGRDSSCRYFATALLRPCNYRYITRERVDLLMSVIQRGVTRQLFRYNDWENCMDFVRELLPTTLKMILLSHREHAAATPAATAAAATDASHDFYVAAPPAGLDGKIIALAGEYKEEKDGKANDKNDAGMDLKTVGRGEKKSSEIISTAPSGAKLAMKKITSTASERLAQRHQRRARRAQRVIIRDARRRARYDRKYLIEPQATRIPAVIPLEPYARVLDDTWTALRLAISGIDRIVDSNDARRIGSLLYACSVWQKMFSDPALVSQPLITPRRAKIVQEVKKLDPNDPFDILLRVVAPATTTTAASAAATVASDNKEVKEDEKEKKESEKDDNNDDDDDDDNDESNPVGGYASADDTTSDESDREVTNDGRSDDEYNDNPAARRLRHHNTRWTTRPPPEVGSRMAHRMYIPDDDVLSVYIKRSPSSFITSLLSTHEASLQRIMDRLRTCGDSYLLPFVIKPNPLNGLKAKAEYLSTVLNGRIPGSDTQWKIEIDRMGDAKEEDGDKKPSTTTQTVAAKRAAKALAAATAATLNAVGGAVTAGSAAAAMVTDDGRELKRGTFAHQPHGTATASTAAATDSKDETKKSGDGREVKHDAAFYKPNHIVDAVMKQIMEAPMPRLFSEMRAKFTGEPGSGDGPTREIFTQIARELFGINSPFFAPSPDGTCLHIRATPPALLTQVLRYYEAIGRFLAIAVKDRHALGCGLSSAIWKCIMSREVTWLDLESFDRPTYMAFKSFMDVDQKVDPTWPQYFVYGVEDADGTLRDIELCPGGATMQLDDTNKQSFVNLWARQRLVNDYLPQLTALVRGFRTLYTKADLAPEKISVEDISALVRGPTTLDLEAMAASVNYPSPFSLTAPQVKWFWQVVGEMNEEQRRRLLIFWSGSPVPPLFGWSMDNDDERWELRPRPSTPPEQLPEASTCSFQLRMPVYRSLDETRVKIMAAIQYGSGYTST